MKLLYLLLVMLGVAVLALPRGDVLKLNITHDGKTELNGKTKQLARNLVHVLSVDSGGTQDKATVEGTGKKQQQLNATLPSNQTSDQSKVSANNSNVSANNAQGTEISKPNKMVKALSIGNDPTVPANPTDAQLQTSKKSTGFVALSSLTQIAPQVSPTPVPTEVTLTQKPKAVALSVTPPKTDTTAANSREGGGALVTDNGSSQAQAKVTTSSPTPSPAPAPAPTMPAPGGVAPLAKQATNLLATPQAKSNTPAPVVAPSPVAKQTTNFAAVNPAPISVPEPVVNTTPLINSAPVVNTASVQQSVAPPTTPPTDTTQRGNNAQQQTQQQQSGLPPAALVVQPVNSTGAPGAIPTPAATNAQSTPNDANNATANNGSTASSANDGTSQPPSAMSTQNILLIVFGAIALLLLVTGCLLWRRHRNQLHDTSKDKNFVEYKVSDLTFSKPNGAPTASFYRSATTTPRMSFTDIESEYQHSPTGSIKNDPFTGMRGGNPVTLNPRDSMAVQPVLKKAMLRNASLRPASSRRPPSLVTGARISQVPSVQSYYAESLSPQSQRHTLMSPRSPHSPRRF